MGEKPGDDRRVIAHLPGAWMYRLEPPVGVDMSDSPRANHVGCAFDSAALAAVPGREELLNSLRFTITREAYHYRRYCALRESLDTRREGMPGDVYYDGLITYLHFEAHALASAARLAVDEIVRISALRAGATSSAIDKHWGTHGLVTKPMAELHPSCLTPEVTILRTSAQWYAWLSAYRNAFNHDGWNHGRGFFSDNGPPKSSLKARSNGLLVPDLASLSGRSKPPDWTWHDGKTIDELVQLFHDGLDDVVNRICLNAWNTQAAGPGSAPQDDRPNMIVSFAVPAAIHAGNEILVPLFTSADKANAWIRASVGAGTQALEQLELVELPVSSDVVADVTSVTISLHGWDHLLRGTLPVMLVVDPSPVGSSSQRQQLGEDVLEDFGRLVSVPVGPGETRHVWRLPLG